MYANQRKLASYIEIYVYAAHASTHRTFIILFFTVYISSGTIEGSMTSYMYSNTDGPLASLTPVATATARDVSDISVATLHNPPC